MMQLDEKKQRTVKMTLRIIVAGYIGFMGGMLVKGYLGDPNIAFLIFGILFLVLAVGFIIYALMSYFKTPVAEDVSSEAAPIADEVPQEDTSEEVPQKKLGIKDIANYKSDE